MQIGPLLSNLTQDCPIDRQISHLSKCLTDVWPQVCCMNGAKLLQEVALWVLPAGSLSWQPFLCTASWKPLCRCPVRSNEDWILLSTLQGDRQTNFWQCRHQVNKLNWSSIFRFWLLRLEVIVHGRKSHESLRSVQPHVWLKQAALCSLIVRCQILRLMHIHKIADLSDAFHASLLYKGFLHPNLDLCVHSFCSPSCMHVQSGLPSSNEECELKTEWNMKYVGSAPFKVNSSA